MAGDRLLIVGGGLASARAIAAYREHGGADAITLLSGDNVVPYHRPPLSKRFLRGEAEATDTLVEPDSFYAAHGVDVRLRTWVTTLSASEREVVLESGETVGYDRLVVASGATPRRLDVPGAGHAGVFTLRTLSDSAAIRDAASEARHAVVVGAGFIGMEVAASLSQLGLEVTLVHRGQGLFEILRARHVSQYLTELYARNGVELVLGDEVEQFGGRSQLDSVTTRRGRVVQAELAVVGVGVTPNVGWLDGSGLRVDDGVIVNERFETGVAGISAVGDVARFYDPIFDRTRRIEHWSNANYQGRRLGELLAGGDGGYDVVSTFFSEVFGVTIKVFGDIDEFDDIVFRGRLEEEDAIGFYLHGDHLVGCVLVGQDEETEDWLKELIRARVAVHDVDRLIDGDVPLDAAFD